MGQGMRMGLFGMLSRSARPLMRPLAVRLGMATSSPPLSYRRPRLLPALVCSAFICGLAIVAPARSLAAPDTRPPLATFCSRGTAGGKYGLASKAEWHTVKQTKEGQLIEATEWANEQVPGGSAASRANAADNEKDEDDNKRWPLLTFSIIRYRLDQEGKPERRDLTVMTAEEECHLVTWLNKCGDIGKPIKDLATMGLWCSPWTTTGRGTTTRCSPPSGTPRASTASESSRRSRTRPSSCTCALAVLRLIFFCRQLLFFLPSVRRRSTPRLLSEDPPCVQDGVPAAPR